MATAQTTTATPKAKLGRKTIKKLGRDKRKAKIVADKEYAKAVFGGKSTRSAAKKVAFRKKKSKK